MPNGLNFITAQVASRCGRLPEQLLQTSYWDAAILASAKALGCQTLYTEDLNHGQDYDGVRAVNPFQEVSASY